MRLDAATRRVVVGPREALTTRRIGLRDVNWIGEGTLDAALGAGRMEVFVKVRSTRPPQPGWLRRTGDTIEVELAGSEEGVAPGQACVLYAAPDGASVLGGGFIASTVSAAD